MVVAVAATVALTVTAAMGVAVAAMVVATVAVTGIVVTAVTKAAAMANKVADMAIKLADMAIKAAMAVPVTNPNEQIERSMQRTFHRSPIFLKKAKCKYMLMLN